VPHFVCSTCGVQHADSAKPPERCPICEDARQYIGWNGQRWTTVEELARERRNVMREDEGVVGIGTEPEFAIGQRALLARTERGNVLWDCTPLLGEQTVARIQQLGGIAAIAVSHPHFHSTMVEWSRAFGDAPIYVHADDGRWVKRRDDAIVLWEGETLELWAGATLVRCGGHFPGATVLHWAAGCGGLGALLTGDTIKVCPDRRWLSFMWSYPNDIPLSEAAVRAIGAAVEPFPFDRIYAGWWGDVSVPGSKEAVPRSVERYVAAIRGTFPPAQASNEA
jgi:hypothetical protein